MSTAFTETGIAQQDAPVAGAPSAPNGAPDGVANAAVDGEARSAVLTCASCGEANAAGSRFCRSCGASLRASDSGTPLEPAKQAAAANSSAAASEATIFDRAVAVPASSSAAASAGLAASTSAASVAAGAQADGARQARLLLDRAFTLAERGDMAGAILLCRQSVALAPDAAQGFSMLGLLLERGGDLEQAAAAYARVLKLAPDSRLEQESLQRIRALLSERPGQAPVFRFNESDLNEALAPAPTAAVAPAVIATSAIAPAAVAAAGLAATPAAAVSTTAPAPDGYPNAPLPLIVGAGAAAQPAPSISALHFDVADAEAEPWWKSVLARPSAFSRGLPLAGVAGLSLLFLIWARGAALSRYPQDSDLPSGLNPAPLNAADAPPPPGAASSFNGSAPSPVAGAPASGSASLGSPAQGAPPGVAGPNDAYPVSNRPAPPAVQGSPNAAGARPVANGAANANTNQNPVGQRRVDSRPQPVFPAARRVVPPAIPNSLPPMRVLPPPAPSVAVSSGQTQGNLTSSGGGPLGPATSSGAETITLTRPRSPAAASPRASSSRAQAEAEAARASRAGRTDEAIGGLSRAIGNGESTGWTYQQRALSFITKGDYQRAADDFQTAISAYRDQKARGERVDEAQAGIAACQSGLALALQNLRH